MPVGSCRTTNLTQALHRLQTPSNRTTGAGSAGTIGSPTGERRTRRLTSRPGAQRCKVWLLHEEGCKPDEVPSIFSLEEKLNALIVAAGITPSKKLRSEGEANICSAT